MDRIFDIINETNQSRLFAITGGFLDVATALGSPTFGRDDLNERFIIFEVLVSEDFAGFEQDRKFRTECFTGVWILCILNALLCLTQEIIKGGIGQKMYLHFLRRIF